MNTSRNTLKILAFCSDEDGVTAIEYALLAALIFGAIVISVGAVGSNLSAFYELLASLIPAL